MRPPKYFRILIFSALGAALLRPALADQDPSGLQAFIHYPGQWNLQNRDVAVSVTITCGLEGLWQLRNSNSEQGVDEVLLEGQGSIFPDHEPFELNLPFGHNCLYLEVEEGAFRATASVDFVCTRDLLPGWPHQSQRELNPLDPQFLPECSALGASFVQRLPQTVTDPRVDLLHWLDDEAQPLPGYPVDLQQQGLMIMESSVPLAVEDDSGPGLIVVGKGKVVRYTPEGAIHAVSSLGGLTNSPPALHVDELGNQRLLVVSTDQHRFLLYVLDLDLNELQSGSGTDMAGVKGQPPVVADVDGDGQYEYLLLANSTVGNECCVVRFDPETLDESILLSVPDFDPLCMLAGELDGDQYCDLVLLSRYEHLLMADHTGIRWQQQLPGRHLCPASLADLDGDLDQELLFVDWAEGSETRLRAYHGDGSASMVYDGLALGIDRHASHAPLAVNLNGIIAKELLIALVENDPVNKPGRIVVVGSNGQLWSTEYFLAGQARSAPLILDLDQDGSLDLICQDDKGLTCAWSTGADDPDPGHVLGDFRHAGNFLQPLPGQSGSCGTLAGRVIIQDTLTVEPGETLSAWHLRLVEGRLEVDGELNLVGDLVVGNAGCLAFSGESLLQPAGAGLDLMGELSLVGQGVEPGYLPSERTSISTLLNELDLRGHSGSTLRIRNCILNELDRALSIVPGQELLMSDSWYLQSDEGVRMIQAQGDFLRCLFQISGTALELSSSSNAQLRDCIFSSGEAQALRNDASCLDLRGTMFLANEEALWHGPEAVSDVDSCHFQGNRYDVIVDGAPESVVLRHSDFIEAVETGVLNNASGQVDARECFWNAVQPYVGDVLTDPELAEQVKPLQIPAPVFDVGTGPMVDGDEPLEWAPVDFTINGIPIRVTYRVYRSQDPYTVLEPDNLLVETEQTFCHDTERPNPAFYVVTTSFGKQVE